MTQQIDLGLGAEGPDLEKSWQNPEERREIIEGLLDRFEGLDSRPNTQGRLNLRKVFEAFPTLESARRFVKDWLRGKNNLTWPKVPQVWEFIGKNDETKSRLELEERERAWKAEEDIEAQSCLSCAGKGIIEKDGRREYCHCDFGQELSKLLSPLDKVSSGHSKLRRANPSYLPVLLGIRPVRERAPRNRGRRR